MSNIIEQLGIKFKSIINPNNTIIKYADGERRITTLLSMLPLIEDVDELIILVDESINNIPLVSPRLSIDFVSCEIDRTGVKYGMIKIIVVAPTKVILFKSLRVFYYYGKSSCKSPLFMVLRLS